MAIIHRISIPDARLLSVSSTQGTYAVNDVFVINQYDEFGQVEIDRLKATYEGYDLYHNNKARVSSIHYHADDEIRIILKGTATFYIPVEDMLYMVSCSELEQITIYANQLHWFSSSAELIAFRLFQHLNSYLETIPKSIDDQLVNIRETIINHKLSI